MNDINARHLLIMGDFNYPDIDWDTLVVNESSENNENTTSKDSSNERRFS